MKEEKKDTVKEENARLAYMVAWRDRYIQKLEERVSGHEEANDILQALLFFALMKTGEPDEAGRITVRVPKAEITEALGKWQCDPSDGGDAYEIIFHRVQRSCEQVSEDKECCGAEEVRE